MYTEHFPTKQPLFEKKKFPYCVPYKRHTRYIKHRQRTKERWMQGTKEKEEERGTSKTLKAFAILRILLTLGQVCVGSPSFYSPDPEFAYEVSNFFCFSFTFVPVFIAILFLCFLGALFSSCFDIIERL